MASSEWDRVRDELAAAGVAGSEDFGKFVNNTALLEPSKFDGPAAMTTLIRLLPTVSDAKVCAAIASHLRGAWARPTCFEALHDSFHKWAVEDSSAGWAIGDSMASAADSRHLAKLLKIATDDQFGMARQMVVNSLWRFRKDERVESTLVALLLDSDVALHAASALQRAIGGSASVPLLEQARNSTDSARVKAQLGQQLGRARKAST